MTSLRRVSVLIVTMEVFAQALTEFRRLRTRMRNTGHLRQIKRITTNEKKFQKKKKITSLSLSTNESHQNF